MMKIQDRRDKMKIYGDLLSILNSDKSEKIVLSRVQLKMNVPYDRLKKYLQDLEELQLIEDQNSLKLTKKGNQFLCDYRKILTLMERMGIGYR
jgi:predicted transcriptional regulator